MVTGTSSGCDGKTVEVKERCHVSFDLSGACINDNFSRERDSTNIFPV